MKKGRKRTAKTGKKGNEKGIFTGMGESFFGEEREGRENITKKKGAYGGTRKADFLKPPPPFLTERKKRAIV